MRLCRLSSSSCGCCCCCWWRRSRSRNELRQRWRNALWFWRGLLNHRILRSSAHIVSSLLRARRPADASWRRNVDFFTFTCFYLHVLVDGTYWSDEHLAYHSLRHNMHSVWLNINPRLPTNANSWCTVMIFCWTIGLYAFNQIEKISIYSACYSMRAEFLHNSKDV